MTPSGRGVIRRGLAALGLAPAADLRAAEARRLESMVTLRAHAARERGAHEAALAAARAEVEAIQAALRARRSADDERGRKAERLRARIEELTARIEAMRAALRPLKFDDAEWERELRARLRVETAAPPPRVEDEPSDMERRFAAVAPDYAAARARWLRGEGRAGTTEAVIEGIRLSLPTDAGDEGRLSQRLVRGWLPLTDLAFVRRFVVGGVMLDVGANVGTTSIPRLLLGDFAAAYAAEPDERNYQCLVGNALDNGLAGRLAADRVALSSSSGTARLRRSAHIGGHQLLASDQQWDGDCDEVRCLTLDAWLAGLDVPPAAVRFVKVDTQGWDLHVLAGATGLLQHRYAVWQIELSASMMKAAGSQVRDLTALVGTYFTHVREIGVGVDTTRKTAADVGTVLASLTGEKRFTNLLLYNTAT